MICNCGRKMQWRCTDNVTHIAKFKCPGCGRIVEKLDDYEPPVPEVHVPKHYYTVNNRFVVRHMSNGKHEYIGCYGDEYTAQRVVEKMLDCDWDKSHLDSIHEELGIRKVDGVGMVC